MTISYSILLVIGAIVILAVMLRKIRKSEMKISDSLFWLFFVVSLIILAVFPPIAYFFSSLFGFQSPANLVFIYVIAVLLLREFATTVELSKLRSKVALLTQQIALDNLAAKDKLQEIENKSEIEKDRG